MRYFAEDISITAKKTDVNPGEKLMALKLVNLVHDTKHAKLVAKLRSEYLASLPKK